jgi:hypothetical protein
MVNVTNLRGKFEMRFLDPNEVDCFLWVCTCSCQLMASDSAKLFLLSHVLTDGSCKEYPLCGGWGPIWAISFIYRVSWPNALAWKDLIGFVVGVKHFLRKKIARCGRWSFLDGFFQVARSLWNISAWKTYLLIHWPHSMFMSINRKYVLVWVIIRIKHFNRKISS